MKKKTLIILLLLSILSVVAIFSFKNFLSYTFPFSHSENIEVISYPNRMEWDTIESKDESFYYRNIVENGKLRLQESKITSRIKLDKQQQHILFNILINSPCLYAEQAACFEPRDAVVFYDKSDNVIGTIEICLECSTIRTSEGIENISLCPSKVNKLKDFFQEIKK